MQIIQYEKKKKKKKESNVNVSSFLLRVSLLSLLTAQLNEHFCDSFVVVAVFFFGNFAYFLSSI